MLCGGSITITPSLGSDCELGCAPAVPTTNDVDIFENVRSATNAEKASQDGGARLITTASFDTWHLAVQHAQ